MSWPEAFALSTGVASIAFVLAILIVSLSSH